MNIARMVKAVLLQHDACNPTAVRIRAGCMTGIVPEALQRAFEIAALQESGCSPTLVIEQVPAEATCSECGRPFSSITFPMLCPQCGGVGMWAGGGDELQLVSVEVDDEDDQSQRADPQSQ
ncbi:hydrogenase maturation nickel metallochaperone HypA [Candidatus Fermentibacteria bacterium]|nr:hydrogenase maturation nickel metallochaperone HypA [Candidatus Fermentibacteria bacterium]